MLGEATTPGIRYFKRARTADRDYGKGEPVFFLDAIVYLEDLLNKPGSKFGLISTTCISTSVEKVVISQ